ncbi:unnamed protein product [Allacma fusca]|uniref:CWH43-like N-terminal domain-containing protein n=1 Tax=Allacma fusca TaxID=39272 RepID=A0A8J2P2H7_9HEXA|nr:unnamed protein product [Allacma fusca]
MSGNSMLYFAPLITGLLFPVTFIITYTISVSADTIKPLFSYISDTGAYPPASGVFTLLLSIASLALAVVVFIRYKQIEEFFREQNSKVNKIFNIVGLFLGLAAALGTDMVGSFQETHSYTGHFTGAFMAFLGGGLYLIMQSYFTFKMVPLFASKVLAWARLFMGIMVCILFLICFGVGTVSIRQYRENGGPDPTRWEKKYGAWELHIISVSTEWMMAAFLDLYILSFIPEFKKIAMDELKFTIPGKPRYTV